MGILKRLKHAAHKYGLTKKNLHQLSINTGWHAVQDVVHKVDAWTLDVIGLGSLNNHGQPDAAPNSNTPGQVGANTIFKAAAPSQNLIYGHMRTAGPFYPIATTGANNEYIHIIVLLAGHELDAIGSVYVNDTIISIDPYKTGEIGVGYIVNPVTGDDNIDFWRGLTPAGMSVQKRWDFLQNEALIPETEAMTKLVRVSKHRGHTAQVADPDLVAEVSDWVSSNVGNGIAYVYLRIKYDKNVFQSGIQNVQCNVRGRRVYDPRIVSQSVTNPSTWTWSNNWALCVSDYLISDMGMRMDPLDIDYESVKIAADISDTITSFGSFKYTIDGRIDTAVKPLDALREMLKSGGGSIVPSVGGKTKIFAGSDGPVSTMTISQSDLLSNIQFSSATPRKSRVNAISGKFSGITTSWKSSTYPTIFDSGSISELGSIKHKGMDFLFTIDSERCQMLAELQINKLSSAYPMNISMKYSAISIDTMDNVTLNFPDLGWSGVRFKVVKWSFTHDKGINMSLVYNDAAMYTVTTPVPYTPPPVRSALITPLVQPIISRVSGLEIFGQGNNKVFKGGNPKFSWRKVSTLDYQAIGSELWGANSGSLDSWFAGYEVTILSSTNVVMRTETVIDNSYIYSVDKNKADFGAPNRSFSVQVKVLGTQGQVSSPTVISVNNPEPLQPQNLSIVSTFTTIFVKFDTPADNDYTGTVIWISETSGFIPSAANLIYEGLSSSASISALPSGVSLITGTVYYLVVGIYDQFGDSSRSVMTPEQSTTPELIPAAAIDNTPPTDPSNVNLSESFVSGLVPSTDVEVSWLPSSDAVGLFGYIIEWTIDTIVSSAFASTLTFTISGLSKGSVLDVSVSATDAAGNTSNKIAATQLIISGKVAATITSPSLSTSAGVDSVTLSWTNPLDLDLNTIRIYDDTFFPVVVVFEGLASSYVIDGFGSTVRSFYSTTTDTSGFESAPSSSVIGSAIRITPLNRDLYIDTVAPSTPGIPNLTSYTNLIGKVVSSQVDISWATVAGANYYIVGFHDNVSTADVEVQANQLSYTLFNQVPGRTVTVYIKAVDWAGNSSVASMASGVIVAGKTVSTMSPPVAPVVIAGLGYIEVSWALPVDSDFSVVRVFDGTSNALLYEGSGTSYIYNTTTAKTVYIKLVDTSGNLSVKSPTTTSLAPVTITSANVATYMSSAAITNAYIGNLNANKITSGNIATAQLSANALTAVSASVTSLDAISANLGSIVSGIITGAIIRTSATNPRVEMSSTGLTAYNSAGTATFQANNDGSGSLGANSEVTWDQNGLLSITMASITGLVVNSLLTGTTGYRVEISSSVPFKYTNGLITPLNLTSAGDLTISGNITGSTITGSTITGGVIRSNASGARVEMTSSGLSVYNAVQVTAKFNVDGSGFLGVTNPISWDSNGVLTVTNVTAANVKTAVSGYRVEMSSGVPFTYTDGTTTPALLDAAGNLTLSGAITAGAGSVIDGAHITNATISNAHIIGGTLSSSVASSAGPTQPITPKFLPVSQNPVYPSNVAVGDTWDVLSVPVGLPYIGWYVALTASSGLSSAANWSYTGLYPQVVDTSVIQNPDYGVNHLFYTQFTYGIFGSAPNDLSTLSTFVFQIQARKVTSWGALRSWVTVYSFAGSQNPAWELLGPGIVSASYTSNEHTQFRLSIYMPGVLAGSANASSFSTVVVR